MSLSAKHFIIPVIFGAVYFIILVQERSVDLRLIIEVLIAIVIFAVFYYIFGKLFRKWVR